MNSTIDSLTLDVADVSAARTFYDEAFDLGERLRFRAADAETSGFRGYTLSIVVAQPADALLLFDAAVAAGASVRKPAAKSLWGFGGVIEAPDGALWNIATSAKKNAGPATKNVDDLVLLIGADDVRTSRAFYTELGFGVRKSFGSYVDFETAKGTIGLGLYKRAALAKSAGVPAEGNGSHRLTIHGTPGAAEDPDGFLWSSADA